MWYEDVQRDLINKCGWSDLSDDDLLKRVCGEGVSDEQLSDISVFMRRIEAARIKLIGVSRREWSVV